MCGILVTTSKATSGRIFDLAFNKIRHRGPDETQVTTVVNEKIRIGFHRLAVMDISSAGSQPFQEGDNILVCNGEIFNYQELRERFKRSFSSNSDCEVLLPLYEAEGLEKMCKLLNGEFAFVIWDASSDSLLAARDPLGIRPLFYGYSEGGEINFASEAKALTDLCESIHAFPPGHFYDGKSFINYIDLFSCSEPSLDSSFDKSIIYKNIHDLLFSSVKQRLEADTELGFLLSGGLDSSLICSIAQKLSNRPIKTFAVGMESDAIDLKYAKIVADYIGSEHTEVLIDKAQVISALEEVIWFLESWDVTTIRASVGMYLICQYIRKNTEIKVLLTGEVSDELFGYKYTDFAPSAGEFQEESIKRIKELYMYDVLRADRCISAHGLEARVPFAEKNFVKYVASIPPEIKMNVYGMGKFLLRKAFSVGDYLPEQILYREKAAFSDAVGHSLVDILKEYAEQKYAESNVKKLIFDHKKPRPMSKEALLYRDIFDSFFPNYSDLIKQYWMPNTSWKNCNVSDPSARFLPNYGSSGH